MTARKHEIPAGFTEGPARYFVAVSQPAPFGMGGYHGGPVGYIEVDGSWNGECPIELKRKAVVIEQEGVE